MGGGAVFIFLCWAMKIDELKLILAYSGREQNKKMQIVVLQTAFSGDVILATPIFEALKKNTLNAKQPSW